MTPLPLPFVLVAACLGVSGLTVSDSEQVILVNFSKEILPFIPKEGDGHGREEEPDGDCSDVLIVSDSTAIAAHNEDGNVALLGHTYLVRATLPDGLSSFTAYTYAGELPSCAFGFNSNGVVSGHHYRSMPCIPNGISISTVR